MGIAPESEDVVHQQFLNKIQMKNTRYEGSLPWKETHPTLPDNYSLSCTRLGSLIRCLRKTPEVLCKYDKGIKDQEQKGIIETIDSEAAVKVHYFPIKRSYKQTSRRPSCVSCTMPLPRKMALH